MATKFELNDTVPAAPAGKINVKWQQDANANISAYVDGVAAYQTPWTQDINGGGFTLSSAVLRTNDLELLPKSGEGGEVVLHDASGAGRWYIDVTGASVLRIFHITPFMMSVTLDSAGAIALGGAVTISGACTATSFTGSGAGLTSIPLSALPAGDYSSKITSGSYAISITGNAATATAAVGATSQLGYINSGSWDADFQNTPAHARRWAEFNGGTNCPTAGGWWFIESMRHSNSGGYWGRQNAWGWEDRANQVWTRNVTAGSFGSWCQMLVADVSGNVSITGQMSAGNFTTAGNCQAATFNGLAIQGAGVPPSGGQILRSDGSGYTYLGWINTVSGDNGTTAIGRIFASNDAFIRYYTPANFCNLIAPSFSGASISCANLTVGNPVVVGGVEVVSSVPVIDMKVSGASDFDVRLLQSGSGASAQLLIYTGQVTSPRIMINENGHVYIYNLPTTAQTAGSKKLWVDTGAANVVKLAN